MNDETTMPEQPPAGGVAARGEQGRIASLGIAV
jgi:hypothetical protein